MSERVLRLAGFDGGPALLVRCCVATGPPVVYVHGATFPSALSAAYRFGGRSWMDDLAGHGFDAWAFDFAGFGGSDRYPQMSGPRGGTPLGPAPEAARQIARVVEHVVKATGFEKVSLIAHSWGTIAAGLYATQQPDRVEKFCLFAPIAERHMFGLPKPDIVGAWRLVTVEEQHKRFVEDVPRGHASVLIEEDLRHWGPAYLDSDHTSASRTPRSVKIPAGPQADILAAWQGSLGYKPQAVKAPVLVVRGEWDSVSNDADADWLLSHIGSRVRKDVKVPKATHLMHLEHGREALFAAARAFLG
jgi:pimeloyl-ACP methyl ester carboxylesterase